MPPGFCARCWREASRIDGGPPGWRVTSPSGFRGWEAFGGERTAMRGGWSGIGLQSLVWRPSWRWPSVWGVRRGRLRNGFWRGSQSVEVAGMLSRAAMQRLGMGVWGWKGNGNLSSRVVSRISSEPRKRTEDTQGVGGYPNDIGHRAISHGARASASGKSGDLDEGTRILWMKWCGLGLA